ncbi:MAG: YCF48-related protein, partial [Bacteroidota bacterium]
LAPEGPIGGDENTPPPAAPRERAEGERRPQSANRGRRGNRGTGAQIANAYFVSDQQAWAVGSSGHIYHTADGGETWERQLGEQLDNFRDVLFFSSAQGWIAGDNGLLLETQDGGKTWASLKSSTNQDLIGVHFVSLEPKWGWAMRRDGTVLYTTDGSKWSAGNTPLRPPLLEDEPPMPFTMKDVAFGKFSEGWAVGSDGQIIHNQDGGPIWTPQRTSTGKDLTSVEMKFVPLGWAVGHSGIVQRTINGGEYWKYHETGTGYDLHAVSFITNRKGWAVGRYGMVLRTTDGGFTWEAESSGVTKDLYGILALSDGAVYAVGAEGTIIHSVDGGVTWKLQHTDIDNDLYAIVRAKDDDTLWVVGQWGVVLRRKMGPVEMSMR